MTTKEQGEAKASLITLMVWLLAVHCLYWCGSHHHWFLAIFAALFTSFKMKWEDDGKNDIILHFGARRITAWKEK